MQGDISCQMKLESSSRSAGDCFSLVSRWHPGSVRLLETTGDVILLGPSVTEILRFSVGCLVKGSRSEDSCKQICLTGWPRTEGGKRRHTSSLLEFENEDDIEIILKFVRKYQLEKKQGRKLLVFVNPYSGTKKAAQVWREAENIIKMAGVETEVVFTERAGHAKEMVAHHDLTQYSGVVSVSGDGLLHEVLNGLGSRPDWDQLRKTLPIGLVPGGSGNAVHCSLMHLLGENFDQEVTVAGLNIASGRSSPQDYIETESRHGGRMLSIFGIAWGFIPEADIGSEVIRWMGPIRAYFWIAWRLFSPLLYHGKVHYLEADTDEEFSMPSLDSPVPPDWTTVSGPFLLVYACKQSWLDYVTLLNPENKANDGFIWLTIIRGPASTMELMPFFFNPSTAGHLGLKQTTVVKVRAFRMEPSLPEDSPVPPPFQSCPMTLDAEELVGGPVQGRIVPGGCRIMVKNEL